MIKEKASKRERLITKKYAFGRVLKDSKNLSKKKRIPKNSNSLFYFIWYNSLFFFIMLSK
jgi:hypothetical protein